MGYTYHNISQKLKKIIWKFTKLSYRIFNTKIKATFALIKYTMHVSYIHHKSFIILGRCLGGFGVRCLEKNPNLFKAGRGGGWLRLKWWHCGSEADTSALACFNVRILAEFRKTLHMFSTFFGENKLIRIIA